MEKERKFKVFIDNAEGKGFRERIVNTPYYLDNDTGVFSTSVTPNMTVGTLFSGADAIQKFYSDPNTVISERNVVIQSLADRLSPDFNLDTTDGAVKDKLAIHMPEFLKDTNQNPINEAVDTVLSTVRDGEEFLEKDIAGFKLYQLVILGLFGLLIVK
tara:strand:+ start:1100 stop:1573 length:474 start_codon:yes stop_codon:yes gene_type:complete